MSQSDIRTAALVRFIRETFNEADNFLPLHEPRFVGNEKKYLLETIDSTFVSSVGAFVDDFEKKMAEFVGSGFAVATSSGTSALHVSLILGGVEKDTEVITQALTFVATCNAVKYCDADPVFLDVDRDTLGLSPNRLKDFLESHCEVRDDGFCWNRLSNKKVSACVPMHTFGFPVRITEIADLCSQYNIALIEDAAESLGSYIGDQHTGRVGKLSAISFNGNKVMTSGGGGMIITDDEVLAERAKHITTTAKIPHRWEFMHDEVGFNYRMPNLNAALGVAQLESLPLFLESKRLLAHKYQDWGKRFDFNFVTEQEGVKANYWMNVLLAENIDDRNSILAFTNDHGVMTRPAWVPMNKLSMFEKSYSDDLLNTNWLADRMINVTSSVIVS